MRQSLKELQDFTKDELIEKILESETVLTEFQESSKELEKALEEELIDLETSNKNYQIEIQTLKNQIHPLRQTNLENGKQIDDLQEILRSKNDEISSIRKQLIQNEILNDSMENQDRILQNKHQLQIKFNHELLEKIAIIEDELERLRKQNFEKQLYITNYQSQIKELNEKINNLECTMKDNEAGDSNEDIGDISLVSIKEMLISTPPSRKIKEQQNTTSNLRKSDSLQKLKNLTKDIELYLGNFNQQVPSRNGRLPHDKIESYKSTSSNHLTTSVKEGTELFDEKDDQKKKRVSTHKRISLSKRYSDLSSKTGRPTSMIQSR
ncbi:uncharacterized protein KGF55_002518 [Candida pseudojiufengensis]|uniref:uncharacterized protein n=1 Tax=Candida pseudojiufengensis TaxID=497109 RepID=UPI00222415CE|nr:uncharacterized protein KGF55_002518 [Candida pseudojiufengensis]KAI5963638.1 hypothetical protein KGF55_002518 [Candida pseudojiufengensis]